MAKKEENIESVELRSEEFQEVLGAVPPWILRRGIMMMAAIVVVLLAGSAIFSYPDVISATITLTGTTPPADIVAKASGKLQKLYVEDNRQVAAHAYLAVIENPAQTGDVIHLKEYLQIAGRGMDSVTCLPPKELRLGSFQPLYSAFYVTLSDYFRLRQHRYYLKRVELLKDRIRRNEDYYARMMRQLSLTKEQTALSQKQHARDSMLSKSGILSAEELENSSTRHLQSRLALENMLATLESLQIQIGQLQESLLEAEYQHIEKKNTLEAQLKSQVAQLATEIQAWELAYVLISPIAGRITFTKYWTENQNIVAGDEVFNVVPADSGQLIGQALLPTTRSGKVAAGQKVNIRFSSFPDTEYGIVRGVVRSISLVPAQANGVSAYILRVELPDGLLTTYKKELPYLPKMEGQADIITENTSLLERFLLPLKKVWTEGTASRTAGSR